MFFMWNFHKDYSNYTLIKKNGTDSFVGLEAFAI